MKRLLKDVRGFTLIELVVVLICVFGIIGYVTNIVKFARCDFKAPYKAEFIHGIGVLGPGCITGYLSVGK